MALDTVGDTTDGCVVCVAVRQEVAYIMWTGDNAPHDNWRTPGEEVLTATSTITTLLNKHFPGVPVFPVIGNHDSAPINRCGVRNCQPNSGTAGTQFADR